MNKKTRLGKIEAQDYRTRLARLKTIDVPVGGAGDFLHEPNTLTVELDGHEPARIFELPLGGVAVVIPAWITVHTSGIVIVECEMRTGCDDATLDLSEPEANPYYRDLVGESPCLNHWLVDKRPLRPLREQGEIVAHSRGSVPPEYRDDTLVRAELLLFGT
ncbi:MAG: hypothetical protein WCC92_11290 [Candidatus Korobacteraceae bacterium]